MEKKIIKQNEKYFQQKILWEKGMDNYYGDKFKCRMDAVGSYSSSLSTMITDQISILNRKCARITFSTFVLQ